MVRAPLKHQVGSAVSARKLNGIVDRLPEDQAGMAALIALLNQGRIRFRTGTTARTAGQLVQIDTWDAVSNEIEAKAEAVVTVKDPVWPGQWILSAIVEEEVPADDYGWVITSGMVVAEFSFLDPTAGWAMIDPAAPTKLTSATGGFARIVSRINDNWGVIQMGHVQPLWRFRALDDGAGETDPTVADILDLNGDDFALAVPVNFTGEIKLDPGDIGSAMQTTNSFECLGGGGFACEDLCDCQDFLPATPNFVKAPRPTRRTWGSF